MMMVMMMVMVKVMVLVMMMVIKQILVFLYTCFFSLVCILLPAHVKRLSGLPYARILHMFDLSSFDGPVHGTPSILRSKELRTKTSIH